MVVIFLSELHLTLIDISNLLIQFEKRKTRCKALIWELWRLELKGELADWIQNFDKR
jgi:hypothetical protein